DQRVGTMNRRAEEILGLSAHAVVHQDLRVLPSPLGDLLFDTLSSGRAMPRTEIQLALRRLWIEVSTYVIRDEEGAPLGAVLVFEDLTAQKELAAQKREADQFQLLTRVVARIADEIKNPLVSINTFIELIGERYDDPDFRRHFSSVVRRDVRRLVEAFEKLAVLVTEGELNFATVDAFEAVTQLVEAIDLAEGGLGKHLQLDVAPAAEPYPVKVDAAQLRRALSYLIRYLTHNSPNDLAKISLSVGRHSEPDGAHDVRILVGSRTAAVSSDKLERLFDPVQMVQESLIDVGPAVSQRLVEALGGRLGVRQTRHELSFVVSFPPAGGTPTPPRPPPPPPTPLASPGPRSPHPLRRRRAATARVASHAPQPRVPDPHRRERSCGARPVAPRAPRRRHPRHQDAGDGRARGPPPRQARRSQHRGRDDHG